MKTGSPTEPSALTATPSGQAAARDHVGRVVARFGVATAVSAAACLAVWSRVPTALSGPEANVGFPTFVDFPYMRQFWAYRLVVLVFPALVLLVYAVLAWRGPLSRRTKPARRPVRLVDAAPATGIAPAPPAEPDVVEVVEPEAAESSFRLGVIPRLGLPAAVVVAAVAGGTAHWGVTAVASGLGYVVAILAVAGIWTSRGPRPAGPSWWRALALTNAVAGPTAALLGLWFVSSHTVVNAAGVRQPWPWLPLWLAVLGIAGVAWWLWRRRESSARDRELTLLTMVVGSVAIFLSLSTLPPPVRFFQGFDDAQQIVGADLLTRGYFPWRDLLFIHGLFPDALQSNLGFLMFGRSLWGVFAIATVLLYPLSWVFHYLYAAWVSRRNPWLMALVGMGVVSGFWPQLEGRFILMPVACIVLGETIRRRSAAWAAALALLLFVQAILIPETSFFAVPAIACVILADLVHRSGTGLWRALRCSLWCVGTAAAALLCFVAALAAVGALAAFVDYYVVFGPGHNVSGALPIDWSAPFRLYWLAGAAAIVVTIWASVARLRRRGDWESGDWVALALTGFLAFYQEKALGRWDGAHAAQVSTVALPLVVWWVWKLFRGTDRHLMRWFVGRATLRSLAGRVRLSRISFVVPAVVVVCALLWQAPLMAAGRTIDTRYNIKAHAVPDIAGIGYMATGAINLALIRDLGTALRAYAGDEPVFDMTNDLGYVYYLLGREPATRFVHVSMAQTPYAQQLLIAELERSRPPVVIYDADRVGLSRWDYIYNDVRHYKVSDYILDGWVPVLRTHGNLLMLRRDLVKPGMPIPSLSQPPLTTDLWFSGVACAWGTTPNFMQAQPSGASVTLPVREVGRRSVVHLSGWAANRSTGAPAPSVVLASGGRALGSVTPSTDRWDVAGTLGAKSLASGFTYAGAVAEGATISAYVLAGDGKLHLLDGSQPSDAASITFPDGHVVATSTSATTYTGKVDGYQSVPRNVGTIAVPAGLRLTDYDLATLSAGTEALRGGITITDQIGPTGHDISATSVPRLGTNLAVRVGSCLQWRGYDPAGPLYVVQDGGPAVQTVTLSGVRD